MSKTTKILLITITTVIIISLGAVVLFWNWYANEPIRIAKREVSVLEKSIDLLKELKVDKFWNEKERQEIRNSTCKVFNYRRGLFANDPACNYLSIKAKEFDCEAETDFSKIETALENTEVEKVQAILENQFTFSRHNNTADFLRGFPEIYTYDQRYTLPDDKNGHFIYTPIDQNWYYSILF